MWKTVALLALAGCTGTIVDFGPDEGTPGGPDAGVIDTPPTFEITVDLPAAVTRDALAADGSWVARVTMRAEASLPARIEWRVGGAMMGTGDQVTVELREDGERTVEAVARDDGDAVLGRASARIDVMPPTAKGGCLGELDALGVDFVEGPAANGIQRPVTVTLPLNGIEYRNSSGTTRRTLFLDCELAKSLYRSAELWKAHGVVAVTDYGIYNYRCINQNVRPPCTGSSFSQHAFAMAIDLALFHLEDGTRLSVNDDFIKDAGHTCDDGPPGGGFKNELLHTLACELYDLEVFKILLTPNYNAAHRNHYHVDLTPGSGAFIGKLPGGVDAVPAELGDE